MSRFVREIISKGNKSLCDYNGSWFVCEDFNQSKQTWTNGKHYSSKEDALNCLMDIEKKPIPYNTLLDIATKAIKGHFDCDTETAFEFVDDILKLDEKQQEILGVPSRKKYDIIEVEFIRKFYCRKEFVVPSGTDEYQLDEYIDSDYDVDDSEFEVSDSYSTEMVIIDRFKTEISYDEAVDEDTYNNIDDLD